MSPEAQLRSLFNSHKNTSAETNSKLKRCCSYSLVRRAGKLDHDQIQHYWLVSSESSEPDFICASTWRAIAWRAFHYAYKHMYTHTLPWGDSLLYFRCKANLSEKIQYLRWGQCQSWKASTQFKPKSSSKLPESDTCPAQKTKKSSMLPEVCVRSYEKELNAVGRARWKRWEELDVWCIWPRSLQYSTSD